MIIEKNIDRALFHFILVKRNRIAAYLQRGNTDEDVVVEVLESEEKERVAAEIDRTLLSEPWSAEMASQGNWEYMKLFCFASANLYGKFVWAYFDPQLREYRCGFEINLNGA
jgi:hypothetical protein